MSEAPPRLRGCVLVLDDAKAWNPIDFGDMFIAHLSCPEIEWVKLPAAAEKALQSDIINRFDVFVLTGSRYNCRDGESLAWFEPLLQLIRAVEADRSKRLYGGCFGHQVVAHALGGVVGKNPNERFVLFAETLVFEGREQPQRPPWLVLPAAGATTKAIVSHGDCVHALPPCSSLRVASSQSCANEGYVTGAHANILCLQSHPEFDYDYAVRDRIWKAVVDTNKRLDEAEVEASRASFEAFAGRSEGPDRLMDMIRLFLCSADRGDSPI